MQSLWRITVSGSIAKRLNGLSYIVGKSYLNSASQVGEFGVRFSSSSRGSRKGEDEWNDAWESAWLPEDLTAKSRAPWESDVNFPSAESSTVLSADADAETKAFVEEMNENWDERRKGSKNRRQQGQQKDGDGGLYSLENMKKDYRLKKQRIHAGLWMKEIEKQEEAKLGDSVGGAGDEIERLLDSYSECVSLYLFNFSVYKLFDKMKMN